jgi:hypothetical protein
LPKDTKVDRWDVDRAIGDGCSEIMVSGLQKGLDASKKCLERWKAAGDGNKVYALRSLGSKKRAGATSRAPLESSAAIC